MSASLKEICEEAIYEGKKVDLSGCAYGEPTGWEGPLLTEPNEYYYFLAGLVRTQNLKNILELGTHYGGSIMSMDRALAEQDNDRKRLVTIDIAYKNNEAFKNYPHIKRIKGDVISKGVIKEAVDSFDGDIDLLFIDSDHRYEHVKTAIYTYANKLKPKYIVLDDVLLNNSMKKFWKEIKGIFKDRAYEISGLGVRKEKVGFGIIDWNHQVKPHWMGTDTWISCYPFARRMLSIFP
jgi:predicted O-methyltransferase YrrM